MLGICQEPLQANDSLQSCHVRVNKSHATSQAPRHLCNSDHAHFMENWPVAEQESLVMLQLAAACCFALNRLLPRPRRGCGISSSRRGRPCHRPGTVGCNDDYFHHWWRGQVSTRMNLREVLQLLRAGAEPTRQNLSCFVNQQATLSQAGRCRMSELLGGLALAASRFGNLWERAQFCRATSCGPELPQPRQRRR